MKVFEMSSNKKKLSTLLAGYDSRRGCERTRVQFPAVPFSLLPLTLFFKRRQEMFRVGERQEETFGIVCGAVF